MDNKFKTKRYDLFWLAKNKHEIAELKRVIIENGLEDKLESYPKSPKDFHQEALDWFSSKGIEVDDKEDVKSKKLFEKVVVPEV